MMIETQNIEICGNCQNEGEARCGTCAKIFCNRCLVPEIMQFRSTQSLEQRYCAMHFPTFRNFIDLRHWFIPGTLFSTTLYLEKREYFGYILYPSESDIESLNLSQIKKLLPLESQQPTPMSYTLYSERGDSVEVDASYLDNILGIFGLTIQTKGLENLYLCKTNLINRPFVCYYQFPFLILLAPLEVL
jgi:hypothetical protein